MKEIMLNGKELTLESLIQITRGNAHVCASLAAMEDVKRSRSLVEALVAGGRPMYGINTGFGLFSEVAIPEEDINLLQIKLILADAAGVGAPLPVDVVRGMLVKMTLSERMDFGNARGMRNTLEKLVQAQANRLAACEGEVTRDMLEEITEADAKAALVGEEEQKQADSENVAQLAERGEQE